MIDHNRLVSEAQASDAAHVLEKAADDIGRVASAFNDVSETEIRRMADKLRTVARLKRAKVSVRRVEIPGDVKDW